MHSVRDVARADQFGSFFSVLQFPFLWALTIGTLSKTSNEQALCCYAKPQEHPSAVATLSIVFLLSAQINSSTRCTVASVKISTGQTGWASSVTFECP
jgi:hypothetical protein